MSESVPDMRTCSNPDCPMTNPQAIVRFQKVANGYRMKMCLTCFQKRKSDGYAARRAAIKEIKDRKKSEAAAQACTRAVKSGKADGFLSLSISFDEHPELLDHLRDLARDSFRTPEQYLLYLIDNAMNWREGAPSK